jgi:hypothetical protein
VLLTLQPKMHHAVSPILGQGSDDECQEHCAEPDGHAESVAAYQEKSTCHRSLA